MRQPGTAIQVVLALLLCMLFIKLYAYFQPYMEGSDDLLAEVSGLKAGGRRWDLRVAVEG